MHLRSHCEWHLRLPTPGGDWASGGHAAQRPRSRVYECACVYAYAFACACAPACARAGPCAC
eukprot:447827-Alexandrium_andersonii.AAC.1